MAKRTCTWCGQKDVEQECPICVVTFPNRPAPATMTPQERVVEMWQMLNCLEIPFSPVHARIEALVGRPVFVHEMGSPETLEREILQGVPKSIIDVLDELPDNSIVVVMPDRMRE